MLSFVLIVVGLRVVLFKSQFLLTRLLCRGEYSLGCGNENNRRCWKNLFLFIDCFKQIFHRRATEKIGWVWYVWSECVLVSGFIVCLFAIQRRGRKSETCWKPLEIELVWLLLLLLLLLHNLECYRTIGTEKEERIEENPVGRDLISLWWGVVSHYCFFLWQQRLSVLLRTCQKSLRIDQS